MKIKSSILFFSIALLLLASCGSLKYEPVETPAQQATKRKQVIKDQLRADFEKQNLKYSPITFDNTDLIKPPSYYKLDSLYGLKLKLEENGKKDEEIEEQIKIQRLIVANDTSKSYFLEHLVFSVKNNSDSVYNLDIYNADFYLNRLNIIESTKIKNSASIKEKYASFYASFILKKSFFAPYYDAEPDELAFYNLYEEKLNSLNEEKKQAFLDFMLSLMKIAKKANSLEKQTLIKEIVRSETQGNTRSYTNEKFEKMEESFDEGNNLLYYHIDYTYSTKKESGELIIHKCVILLDPYLQILEITKN